MPVDPVRVLQAVTSARACRQAASRRATIVPRRLSFTGCACRKTRSEQRSAAAEMASGARSQRTGAAGRRGAVLSAGAAVTCGGAVSFTRAPLPKRRRRKPRGARSRSKFAERVIAREAWYENVTQKKAPS